MRVIAGTLGGRQFDSPRGHRTHPMSDKIRGAIFNMLGDISNLTLLDAFAGSGALSFEAISRGADHVIAIDVDKQAYETMQRNVRTLGITARLKVIRANASGWSDNNPNTSFDIVLCDPPYDKPQEQLVRKLCQHVADDGLLVLSYPGDLAAPDLPLNLIKNKLYGDAQLIVYQK